MYCRSQLKTEEVGGGVDWLKGKILKKMRVGWGGENK